MIVLVAGIERIVWNYAETRATFVLGGCPILPSLGRWMKINRSISNVTLQKYVTSNVVRVLVRAEVGEYHADPTLVERYTPRSNSRFCAERA